jgi:hypothetical protein
MSALNTSPLTLARTVHALYLCNPRSHPGMGRLFPARQACVSLAWDRPTNRIPHCRDPRGTGLGSRRVSACPSVLRTYMLPLRRGCGWNKLADLTLRFSPPELSLTVPIVNTLAFLFTVLGEWYVEGKMISRGELHAPSLSLSVFAESPPA